MTKTCQVVWGDPLALTEDEPNACEDSADYVVYLDCQHKDTIAFKENNLGRVCKHHADMVEGKKGICGCNWVVINERLYPDDVPGSVGKIRQAIWESGDA